VSFAGFVPQESVVSSKRFHVIRRCPTHDRFDHRLIVAVLVAAVLAAFPLLTTAQTEAPTNVPTGNENAAAVDAYQASATTTGSATDASADEADDADLGNASGGKVDVTAPRLMNPLGYHWWVLAPPLVAILLAMLMRSAIPGLAIGVIVGGYMMAPCLGSQGRFFDGTFLSGVGIAFERYVVDGIVQPGQAAKEHVLIVLFTLIIGGMVGIIAVNGGTRALVHRVARFASSSRRGQLSTWLAGMVVFFDDYANSMIVGPTMRPMCDELKISRAKLSYIVDSTAAPVASIALIGTWLGAELGYIQNGLNLVKSRPGGVPMFLENVGRWDAFLQSIPYRFYAIFALWMVLVIALTGRDFGPMRRAEQRALTQPPDDAETAVDSAATNAPKRHAAWLAGVPILVLVGVTVALLYLTGLSGLRHGESASLRNVLLNADSYISILYGAAFSFAAAMMMSVLARACSIRAAMDGALDGMARMFPAIAILVLAWALSGVTEDLHLGEIISTELIRNDLAPAWLPLHVWLPLIVFLCAAGVSFATGSSWATMAVLTPVAIQTAATLGQSLPVIDATEMFYATVGSVLAGAIFGDHCSPISDTTVLSAVASGCRVEEHVWTQLPYALLAAMISIGAGNVYCATYHVPAWKALLLGAGVIVILTFLLGRKPVAPPAPPPSMPPATIERRLGTG